MKNILNNLSEEEKNSIREQHTGGMKVDNSRFKTLLENKSGNVKPLVEQDEPSTEDMPLTTMDEPSTEDMPLTPMDEELEDEELEDDEF